MAQPSNGRGFAALAPGAQRKVARAGGKAAHESGHAHEWDSQEARAAGRLGGLAAHHHRRAAFHHETAALHHERAAHHHAAGDPSRADLHAESAYEHEQRAAEHGERAYHTSRGHDQDAREGIPHENLDRGGADRDSSRFRDERAGEYFGDEVEPRRSGGGANLDRGDDADYGVNARSEPRGTAREDS